MRTVSVMIGGTTSSRYNKMSWCNQLTSSLLSDYVTLLGLHANGADGGTHWLENPKNGNADATCTDKI